MKTYKFEKGKTYKWGDMIYMLSAFLQSVKCKNYNEGLIPETKFICLKDTEVLIKE